MSLMRIECKENKLAFQGFADASLISTQQFNALSTAVLLQMPVSCTAHLLSYNIKSDTRSLYVHTCKHCYDQMVARKHCY